MERPLTGEPLAVDLVNTHWRTADGPADLLSTTQGATQWLRERGLPEHPAGRIRETLVHTRGVLQRAFEHRPGADDDVNAILARALIVRVLVDGRVQDRPIFADDVWRAAWLAVDDYVRLRQAGADDIRRCGNAACVLYFHDPSGRRLWCSMASCGNREKARRHYLKQKQVAGTADATPGHGVAAGRKV